MKMKFGKNKDIEIISPEEPLEKKLENALQEIDFLTEQLKTPLKESRRNFRERQEVLEKNLNRRYNEGIDSLEKAQELLDSQIAEFEALENKYTQLLCDLNSSKESFEKEKRETLESLNADFADKIAEFNRQKSEELDNLHKHKDDIIDEAQCDAYDIVSSARKEQDEIIRDIERRESEFEKKCADELVELNKEREKLKQRNTEILDSIDRDIKTLKSLEKQVSDKDKLNRKLSKSLFKKFAAIFLCLAIIISLGIWSFRHDLFPLTTMSSSVSSLLDSDFSEVSGDIVFAVNGEAITKLSLFDGVNKFRGEEYFALGIKDDSNSFDWERYNKGDAEFIKVPYESQYVLAKNRNDAGWHFDKNESQKLMLDIYYSLISGIDVTEKNIVSEYNGSNIFSNLWIFVKNRFVPNQINYTFNLNPEGLKSVYGILKSSAGYQSFTAENNYIKECLKLTQTDEIDKLLTDTFVLGNMTEAIGKIQIKNGVVTNIGVNFHGTNNNQDKISIYCTFSFNKIDRNKSYEKQIFMMNSMPYNEVYPRIEQEDFEDMESQGNIQENISTLKDLEDKGYDFSG